MLEACPAGPQLPGSIALEYGLGRDPARSGHLEIASDRRHGCGIILTTWAALILRDGSVSQRSKSRGTQIDAHLTY